MVVGVFIVVLLVVFAAVLVSSGTHHSTTNVTITGLGFEWDTPPSTLCPTFGVFTPGVPFTVSGSSNFTVSWEEICEANSPIPNTTYYVIQTVSAIMGSPFGTVSSNVPVDIFYTHYTWFNVTFSAPANSWTGELDVWVTASEN